ncbi:MAG: SIMPL domain-containing protein [bacterium]
MRFLILLTLLLFNPLVSAHDEVLHRILSTHGIGEIKTTPDEAMVNFSAQVLAKTSADAMSQVESRVNGLIDALAGIGVGREDIVAGQVHLTPRYDHTQDGRRFAGYQATRNVRATLKDLKKIPDALDAALESGIDNIGGIAYRSSREEELQAKARNKAIADSREKAEFLAKAYGARLGSIATINYYSNRPMPVADARPEMGAMSIRSAAPPVYLPDEITLSETIQVTFELLTDK